MNNIERSLVLIKPDAVERNLCGKILSIYEEAGLKIIGLKLVGATKTMAKKHYKDHVGKPYFDELIQYITRSGLIAIILEGEDAIERIRKINGSTKPSSADNDTIRGMFGINDTENSVHASDSYKSAKREINIWFL